MIIDAHVHLPVVGEQRTYEQARETLLADLRRHGVDYAILIPDNIPDSCIGDFETCHRLFAHEPRVFLQYMLNIEDLAREGTAPLEQLMTERQIVAVKIVPGHDPFYPTGPRLDPAYALCQTHQVAMVIHTGWNSGHPEVRAITTRSTSSRSPAAIRRCRSSSPTSSGRRSTTATS